MSHAKVLTIVLLLFLTSIPASAQKTAVGSVELITTLSGHTKNVEAIDFNHAGDVVASSSGDKTVRLWRVATGECLATLVEDGAVPWKLDWSNDDRRLALTYRQPRKWVWEVAVWDLQSVQQPAVSRRFRGTYFLEWSPDNRTFLGVDQDAQLNIWDASSGELLHTLKSSQDLRTIGFASNGQQVLTTPAGGPVQRWEIATGKVVDIFPANDYPSPNLPSFSPDKRVLLSGSVKLNPAEKKYRSYLTLRKIEDGEELVTAQLPDDVHTVYWAPDGKTFAVVGYEFNPRLIDAATGREISRLPFDNCWPWTMWGSDGCEPLKFSNDGAMLLQAKEPIRLWEPKTVTLIAEVKGAHLPAVFSPTGTLLATRGKDKKTVSLWRVRR